MAKWTEEQKLKAKEAYKKRMEENDKVIEDAVEKDQKVLVEDKDINKFEKHDGPPPVNDWNDRPLSLNYDNKIQSMKNAIKILPPNMIVNGRHKVENIQAICGFSVSEQMMDEAYEGFVHQPYN